MNYATEINDFIKEMRCESCKTNQLPIYKIDSINNESINCCCEPFSVILQNRINQMAAVVRKVTELNYQVLQAKDVVRDWMDANASLSRSAAEERAKNKSMGRGLLAGLLGSTYRTAMRSAAANSNAAISADVAAKRAMNAEGKRRAQENVRHLQAELSSAKQELRMLKGTRRVASLTRDKSET